MKDMLKRWISILCVFVMVTLILFPGGSQVKAAGESNIISFADLHFDGFTKTAEWVPAMGDIAEITLDMPGITVKNIRFDLSSRKMSYDIALDKAAIMTSGSRTYWFRENQRTRYLDIAVYMSNSSSSSRAGSYTHKRVENLTTGESNNKFITNQDDLVAYPSYPWEEPLTGEIPSEVSVLVSAGDNHHIVNDPLMAGETHYLNISQRRI